MRGGIEETSASFEARYAPRSYPTCGAPTEPDFSRPSGDALALASPAARGCASSPRCRDAPAGRGRSQPWLEQQLEDLNARRHDNDALEPNSGSRRCGLAARGELWNLAPAAIQKAVAATRAAAVAFSFPGMPTKFLIAIRVSQRASARMSTGALGR
jgi:hypothetical protein